MDSKSIFHLETSPSGLMDSGVHSYNWKQYPCTRDTSGANFSNGSQRWRWEGASTQWFLPSQSYLRYRLTITGPGGVVPLEVHDIAPAMNTCSQLYQSMSMKMGGQTLSRINDYVAQCDTLKKRMNLSKSLLDSTCDTKGNFEPGYKCRQSKLAADAVRLDKVTELHPGAAFSLTFDAGDTLEYEIINEVPTITMVTGMGTDFTTELKVGDIIQFDQPPGAGTVPDSGKFCHGRILTVAALVITLDRRIAGDAKANADTANRISLVFQNPECKQNKARRKNEIELIYKPPLSFFDYQGALPMACKYELEMVPHTRDSLKRRIMQSLFADKAPGTDFDVSIDQVYLYLAEVDGPALTDSTFYMDNKEINIQAEKIDSRSLAQKNFDVPPSTKALTVFYQDERANAGTRVSDSIFKSYNAGLSNIQPNDISEELKLQRYYVQYGGKKYPPVDWDPVFADRKDNFTQLWLETQCATGGKYDTGGAETIDDWLDRGLYLHHRTPKAPTDRSTRVSVHQSFDPAVDIDNMRVMLCSHYCNVWEIQVKDSRVKSVKQFQV